MIQIWADTPLILILLIKHIQFEKKIGVILLIFDKKVILLSSVLKFCIQRELKESTHRGINVTKERRENHPKCIALPPGKLPLIVITC